MNQFGVACVWCAVQVTLLSVVATSMCFLLRRRSPSIRSWTAWLALVGTACLSILVLCPVPSWFSVTVEEPAVALVQPSEMQADTPSGISNDSGDAELGDSQIHEGNGFVVSFATAFVDELTSRPHTAADSQPWWPTILAFVILVCASLGLFQLGVGWLAAHRYRVRGQQVDDRDLNELLDVTCARLNCRRSIQLLEVDGLASAATIGYFRPVILLPTDWRRWTTDECRVVLAHEVAHIAHGDYLTGLVAQFCLALHFYHPLVHWLVARMRLDQELSADATAAVISGGQRHYLATLAEMALRQDDRMVPFPARMFIPTRQSFLRRIEMLRTWKVLPDGSSAGARSAAIIVMLAFAVMIAGLRSPVGEVVAQAQPRGDGVEQDDAPATFDTRFVSEDGGAVIAIRPARMMQHSSLEELRKTLDSTLLKSMKEDLGFHPADIDQVILTSNVAFSVENQTQFFVRGTKPIDFSRLVQNLTSKTLDQLDARQYGEHTVYAVPDTSGNSDLGFVEQRAFWLPDDRTLVYDTIRHLRRYIHGDPVSRLLLDSEVWNKMHDRDAVVLADQESLQQVLRASDPGNPFTSLLVKPLVDKTRLLGASLEVGENAHTDAIVVARNDEDAKVLAESLGAARVLAKNMLGELANVGDRADLPPDAPQRKFASDPLTRNLIKLGRDVLSELTIEQTAEETRVDVSVAVDDLQLKLLGPALVAAQAAAQRAQSMNNLKQIGLAFHIYHDVHKHFPGNAQIPEGKRHPVSWRVAILPYIEQKELYDQYNFDEPWDSETNRKLIEQMPPVYRHPSAPSGTTSPSYFVLTGAETIFRGNSPQIRDIRDGTSNTFLAVEAKKDIPWTKPEDIEFERDKKVPTLGGYAPQGFNAGFADGSVKFIANSIDEHVLKLMIMSQDGQPIRN